MKITFIIMLGFFICSCGRDNHDSNSSPTHEVDSITRQEPSLDKEIQELLQSGLHFARLSNLQDPKRPMTLYCSNTESLNQEKILQLQRFSESLQYDTQETYLIKKVEVKVETLLQLIIDAIKLLERDPYSSTCPQIYLAIQSP